jgi:hypothetical protein
MRGFGVRMGLRLRESRACKCDRTEPKHPAEGNSSHKLYPPIVLHENGKDYTPVSFSCASLKRAWLPILAPTGEVQIHEGQMQRFSVRANYPAGDPACGQRIKVILKTQRRGNSKGFIGPARRFHSLTVLTHVRTTPDAEMRLPRYRTKWRGSK